MSEIREKLDYEAGQRFSCSCCGACCNNLEVTITGVEKAAIEKFRLNPAVSMEGAFIALRPGLWNIAKNADGRCVFIGADGRCRLHREGGVELKPLACRLYPFAIHNWSDRHISVDGRYYCPAVGMGNGELWSRQEGYFRTMAQLLTGREKVATVKYSDANPASLGAVRWVNLAFLRILGDDGMPLPQRLYAAARILDFHARRDQRAAVAAADEAFAAEAEQFIIRAREAMSEEFLRAGEPDLDQRMKFRLAAGGFFRDDAGRTSWRQRFSRGLTMARWAMGRGSLHELNPTCPDTTGIDVAIAGESVTFEPEALALLERFILAKISSLHHCGPAALKFTWEDGMRHLLTASVVLAASAGLLTRSAGRDKVDAAQMRQVLSYVDTSFRLSPYFRTKNYRKIITRLCRPGCYAGILQMAFSGTGAAQQ